MIDCKKFYNAFLELQLDFFSGVPDSLLRNFCSYVTQHTPSSRHLITANEGSAIALAAGYHLSTGKSGVVYMQNSGLGNAVNPLTSLTDSDMYGIPLLMLIGWRGEPGIKDEPQHFKQGLITLPLLQTLGVPYEVLTPDTDTAIQALKRLVKKIYKKNSPCALVVRKNSFAPVKEVISTPSPYQMLREDALKIILEKVGPRVAIVATTGKTSRELFENRESAGFQDISQDFFMVGSMGHASQIALGIALAQPDRIVLCLDGDGATIMHMGSLAIIGSRRPPNLKHVIINNGCHDSVGGQPTVGFEIDLPRIALANGYPIALRADKTKNLKNQISAILSNQQLSLLEIRVRKGARLNLGRPKATVLENKRSFEKFLKC